MNLGHTIKKLRRARGISQQELADASSLSMTYVSLLECNKKEPSIAALRAICRELEIPVAIVFFLSLEADDVQEHKRAVFEQLAPAMNAYLKTVFID